MKKYLFIVLLIGVCFGQRLPDTNIGKYFNENDIGQNNKIEVFNDGTFRVTIKQIISSKKFIRAEIENLSDKYYRAVWFNIKANYVKGGETFEEKARFSDLKISGSVIDEIEISGELTNLTLELNKSFLNKISFKDYRSKKELERGRN